MPIETSYSSLRANLATVMDQIVDDQEVVIVRRRGARDVAMLPASELAGLQETAHLLRSPKNAQRLMNALANSYRGTGRKMTTKQLRKELGLESASKA